MAEIKLAGVTPESVVDGVGLRCVIWAQGCKHGCQGCHSPYTWNFQGGQWRKIEQILNQIKKNRLLQGVTFSGGDPFEQAEKFVDIARQVKEWNLDVWCYTGYTWDTILQNSKNKGWQELLAQLDVLVDGPYKEEEKEPGLAFRGSKNQRVIDVLRSLKEKQVVLFDL